MPFETNDSDHLSDAYPRNTRSISTLPPLPTHSPPPPPPTSPLLVSLLDGTLVAVNPDTGAPLWAFDSGSPLVSAAGLAGGASGAVVPAADGRLFAHRPDARGRGLEPLPTRVPDLVDAAPTLADGGATVVLGSHSTTLFLLDAASGALERAFVQDGSGAGVDLGALVAAEEEGGSEEDTNTNDDASAVTPPSSRPPHHPHRRHVAVGRHDYLVRAVDAASGAPLWNLTWSRLARLPGGGAGGPSSPDPSASPASSAAGKALGATSSSDPDAGGVTTADAGLWSIGAGADARGPLLRRAPADGSPSSSAWTLRLPSPAVAAFDAEGGALPLGGGREGESEEEEGSGGRVVVTIVDDALVVLPAGSTHDDDASAAASWVALADGGSGEPPVGAHPVLARSPGDASGPRFLPGPRPLPPASASTTRRSPWTSVATALLVGLGGGAALAVGRAAAARGAPRQRQRNGGRRGGGGSCQRRGCVHGWR